LLSFACVYFFRSRLFNGLQPIKIKKLGLFDLGLYSRRPTGADGFHASDFPRCRTSATEPGELNSHIIDSDFSEGFVNLGALGGAAGVWLSVIAGLDPAIHENTAVSSQTTELTGV
jgi:hypothetical protein